MKRLLRIIAELVDDETGQVSQAKMTPPDGWQIDYGELVGSSTQGVASPVALKRPDPEVAPNEAIPPPDVGEAATPITDPVTPDDRMPTITVADYPADLHLYWDEGVTSGGRSVHMAPFSNGMWQVIKNGSEYAPFFIRAGVKTLSFEPQGSAHEAKALAMLRSREWMEESQGDGILQRVAAELAEDVAQYVGLKLENESHHYHFKKGRVRREINTTVVVYGGHMKGGPRPRLEFRLTPKGSINVLQVWGLRYTAGMTLSGSLVGNALPRERLAELANMEFGPVPGKSLVWKGRGQGQELTTWGQHRLLLKHGPTVSALFLLDGEEVFLDCGNASALKTRAVTAVQKHFKGLSKRRSQRADPEDEAPPDADAELRDAPKPEPEAEPMAEPKVESKEAKEAKEPEPEPELKPKKIKTVKVQEVEKLRLKSEQREALARFVRFEPGSPAALEFFDELTGATRRRLVSQQLVSDPREGPVTITKRGEAYLLRFGLLPEARPASTSTRRDDDVSDDNEDEGVTDDQGSQLVDGLSQGVQELVSKMPPPPR